MSTYLRANAKPWAPPGSVDYSQPTPVHGLTVDGVHGLGLMPDASPVGSHLNTTETPAATEVIPRISLTAAKLFIGQLPFECNERRLHELFGAYGTVEHIHIMRDPENRSRGAAFLTYSNVEEADTAIFTLHNRYRMLTNRAIQVSYAKNSLNMSRFGATSAIEVHHSNPSNPIPELVTKPAD